MQNFIKKFHLARESGDDKKAGELLREMKSSTQLSDEELFAAVATIDFSGARCKLYCEKVLQNETKL